MQIFQTIKFRIIALSIGLALIGILVRQFLAIPLVRDQVHELAATQQLSIATYIARDVDHSITSRQALIERFATELPEQLTQQPEKLQAWLKERQDINPMFNSGLMAVRPDGLGLFAEYPSIAGRSQLNYAHADWFMAALRTNKAVIGKPTRGRANGDPVIIFAAPVRNAAGRIVTVLAGVAQLNAPGFLDRLQETQLGTTGGFLLVSPVDQLFVAASDPDMILQPTPRPGVNLLHDRAMTGFRGTGVTINAKGVEELSAMVSVPSTGWFVVARMPTKEAFRLVDVLSNFIAKSVPTLIITIVTILLVALPRILRPLTDTARAMRHMADGKTRLEKLPVIRNDEVGELVKGFNFLVERLHKEEAAREASDAKLRHLAQHDSLTGLYNRAMLEERLGHALDRAARDGSQVALLFCDLDGFKPVNDQHGHDAGDEVLRQVAHRLSDGRRRVDTVARLGGDEFVILLTGLKDARAGAAIVAQQCLDAIAEPFEVEGKLLSLGISIGIAKHAGPAVSPSYLIAQADIAMYQAKRKGKGNYLFVEEADAVQSAA